MVGRERIKEREMFFIKERVTQGYQFYKAGEPNDYIYMLVQGKVRELVSTREGELSSVFTDSIKEKHSQCVLGYGKVGETFGEKSSFSNQVNHTALECASKVAVVYKIHRTNLIQHFGGQMGEPTNCLRALSLTKTHWIRLKIEAITKMTPQQLESLEYRDDSVYNKLQKLAKATYVKEKPFISAEKQT